MKAFIRIVSIVLLLFNGLGAIYGGWLLITDPSGASLQMPSNWLEASPFNNYLIPGVVLFTVNGLYNLLTAVLVMLRVHHYSWYTMVAGALLIGWITLQVIFVRIFYAPLHLSFFLIGLAILWCGFLMYKAKKGDVEYAAM